jgi:hypothetical protein
MDLLFGLIAAVGLGLAVIVHALTYYPGPSLVTAEGSPVWLLHVGIFVAFVPFVFSVNSELGPRPRLRDLLAVFPRWARVVLVAALLYTGFNFFSSFSEGGTPEIRNNQFVLMNHGKLIRTLSQDEYVTYKRYVARGFSGHWIFFYLVPTLYFLFRRRLTSNQANTAR